MIDRAILPKHSGDLEKIVAPLITGFFCKHHKRASIAKELCEKLLSGAGQEFDESFVNEIPRSI